MEFIQFFNRTTGQWSERYRMVVGYSEIWVIDKTTDTAKDIKFFVYAPFNEEPPYKPNDWCRLVHIDNDNINEPMTYDSQGLPLNSSQYLVDGIQKVFNEDLDKWSVSLTLKEPIERFNGILGETLTYTNQTQKVHNDITYIKEPYNHYTALRRWLLVTPANCDVYKYYLEVGQNLNGQQLLCRSFPGLFYNYVVTFSSGQKLKVTLRSSDNIFELTDTNDTVIFTKTVPINETDSIVFGQSVGTITDITVAYALYRDTLTYAERFQRSTKNISWWNRIKILDEDWLKTLSFGNDTYNELNLYNVLMDNYNSSTGRTPVAYFDIDPVTDLPRNLNRDEYLLKFERQDGFDKPVIDFDTFIEKNIGIDITQDSNNYATGLVCNAENLSSGIVHYPAKNLYAVPEVDADVRNTTGTPYNQEGRDNWVLRLPTKIKKVTKLERVEINGSEGVGISIYSTTIVKADRTDFAVEKQQYLSANPNDATADIQGSRFNWYEEGGNKIYMRDMFYNEVGDNFIYYIEYEPFISAKLITGSEDYAQQLNQNSSQVAAAKLSSFMTDYLAGMNKADITVGKHYYEEQYSEFENLIGSRVKRGDREYMITQVAYRNRNFTYDVFFQLNENHTRKNHAYKASQEIRPNTAIATSNFKNRLTAIKQTVKIGTTAQTATGYNFLVDKSIAISTLLPSMVAEHYYPQIAVFEGRSILTTEQYSIEYPYSFRRSAVLSKFVFGNQANLSVVLFDNAEAGKFKVPGEYEFTLDGYGYKNKFLASKSQIPVLYTDAFGELQTAKIQLASVITEPFTEGTSFSQSVYEERLSALNAMANLPIIDGDIANALMKSVEVTNLNLYKDMLETANINIIIELLGVGDVIVCKDLIRLSRLLSPTDAHTLRIYAYNTAKAENDSLNGFIANITVTSSGNITGGVGLYFSPPATDLTGKTVVVTTNTYQKLLIINNISSATNTDINAGVLKIYVA